MVKELILPEKHIYLSETLYGIGGLILSLFDDFETTLTVDALWIKLEKKNKNKKIIMDLNFDKFILSIDFLFTIGALDLEEGGKLKLCI